MSCKYMFNVVGQSKLEDVVLFNKSKIQQRISPRLQQLNEVDNLIRSSLMQVVKEERRSVVKQLVDNRFDLAKVSFVDMQKKVKDKLWLLWWKSWQVVDDVSFFNQEEVSSVAEFAKSEELLSLIKTFYDNIKLIKSLEQDTDPKAQRFAQQLKENINADYGDIRRGIESKGKVSKNLQEAYEEVTRQKNILSLGKDTQKQSGVINALKQSDERLSQLLKPKTKRTTRSAQQLQQLVTPSSTKKGDVLSSGSSTYGDLNTKVAAERLRERKENALDLFEKREQSKLNKAQERYGKLLEKKYTLPQQDSTATSKVNKLQQEIKQLKEQRGKVDASVTKQLGVDPKIQEILDKYKINIKGKSVDQIGEQIDSIENMSTKEVDTLYDYFDDVDPEALTKGVTSAKVEGEKVLGSSELKRKQRQLDYWRKQQGLGIKDVAGLKKGRQLLAIEQEQQRLSAKNKNLFLTTERNRGNDRNNAVDYFVGESDFGRVYLETRLNQISKQFADKEQEQVMQTMEKIHKTETNNTNKSTSVVQQYFEKSLLTYNKEEKVSYELGGDVVDDPKFAPIVADKRLDNKQAVVTSKQRNSVKLYNQVENILYQDGNEAMELAQQIIKNNPNKDEVALTEQERQTLGIVKRQPTYKISTIKKYTKQQNTDNLAFRVGRIVRTELAAANHLGRLTHIVLNDDNGLVKWVVDDEHLSRGVVCSEPINKKDQYVTNNRVAHGVGCRGRSIGQSVGLPDALQGIYRTVDVMTQPTLFIPLHPFCLCSIRALTKGELDQVAAASAYIDKTSAATLAAGLASIGAGQVTPSVVQSEAIPVEDKDPNTWGMMAVTAGATVLAAGLMYAAYRKAIAKVMKNRLDIKPKTIKPEIEKGTAKKVIEQGIPQVDKPTPNIDLPKKSKPLQDIAKVDVPDVVEEVVPDRPIVNIPDVQPVADVPTGVPLPELKKQLNIKGLDEAEMVRVDDYVMQLTDSEVKARQMLEQYEKATPEYQRTLLNLDYSRPTTNVEVGDILGDAFAQKQKEVNELQQLAQRKKLNLLPPRVNVGEIESKFGNLKATQKITVGKTQTDIIETSRLLEDRLDKLLEEVNNNKNISYKDYLSLKKRISSYNNQQQLFDAELGKLLEVDDDVRVGDYLQTLIKDAKEVGVKLPPKGFVRHLEKRSNLAKIEELIEQQRYANKIKKRGYRSLANPDAKSKVDKQLVSVSSKGQFLRNVGTIIKQLETGNTKVISKSQIRYLVDKHGEDNTLLQEYLAKRGTPKLNKKEVAEVVKLLQQEREVIRKAEFRKKFAQQSTVRFTRPTTTSSFFKPKYRYNFN